MIRLTDEEINAIWPDGWDDCDIGRPKAQAQLKKVVGWLLDNELHPERDGLELSGKSFLSLLDEIK